MAPGGKHLPPPTKMDPRTYIKPLPLKITDQKGVKIQARSDHVYNPVLPSRDDVRKGNYDRRQYQMRHQGFRSRPDQPYKGIGDPFYLDEKKLILHALGQWEEGQQLDTSSSSESEDDIPQYEEKPNKKKLTTANFVLRRSKKGLNTLNKDVSRARAMIRNVRLGHGLFELLRKEREERNTAKQREEMRRRREQATECQPPCYNTTTDDDTDVDDVDTDVDISSYMTPTLAPSHDNGSKAPSIVIQTADDEPNTDQTKSRVAFQGMDGLSSTTTMTHHDARSQFSHSARSRSSRNSSKKKLPPARPYTPQHSYIGVVSGEVTDSSDVLDIEEITQDKKTSLFRQLCALNWLLEAMNIEAPVAMGSITTCWSLREIGGAKTTVMKQQNERKSETRWKQFVTNQVLRGVDGYLHPHTGRRTSRHRSGQGTGVKRGSLFRINRMKPRTSMSGRNSVASVGSVTESQLGLEPGMIRAYWGKHVIPEDGEVSHDFETGTDFTEDEEAAKGPLRYLEDCYDRDQSSYDMASQPDVMSARSDRSSSRSRTASPHQTRPLPTTSSAPRQAPPPSDTENSNSLKKSASPSMMKKLGAGGGGGGTEVMPSAEEKQKILDAITRYEEDPRTHAFAHRTEKMSSKDLRADLNPHPKVTPAVLEYQASLPSTRVGTMANDQRQKFSEVSQEKALLMHDALEAKERQRLRLLQNKFLHMPTGGSSFHRALKEMRSRSAVDEELRERRRHSSTTHQAWYIEILQNVPEEIKKEWFFQVILDKLSKYGMVDSPKQSALKLLKVISGLRDWEVCCPDIAAAIEYCRDSICDMSIDDYEEWFRSQFPTVLRPQTAPAANRNDKNKKHETQNIHKNKNIPRSAPPCMTRGAS